MTTFRFKLQIFGLLIPNRNKYNPFLQKQSWHCARLVLCSKKNVNEDKHGPKEKMRFWGFRKASLTKRKRNSSTNLKKQKSPEQKLSFWEYIFGLDPKKFWPDPSTCRLAVRQRQDQREKDPRLCDPHYQATAGDVLIYTKAIRSSKESEDIEPQPKPPPAFKLPTAVLLNRLMMEGFDDGRFKKDDNYDDKMVTPTEFRKPYEEMKPSSDTRRIIKYRMDVGSKDIQTYEKPAFHQVSTQINVAQAHDVAAKILRQAMEQKEPQKHSRIERLNALLKEKVSKSQCATSSSQINSKCQNPNIYKK